MKRFVVLVTVAAILAAMLVAAGPASAQAGCKALGNGVAFEVRNGTLRQEIPTRAPVNDDVRFFKGLLCE